MTVAEPIDTVDAEPPSALEEYRAAWREGWRLDRASTVSEWADRYRVLTSVDSSEHGQWSTDRTPYLREVMDCLSAGHPARRVVLMAGAQLGKTSGVGLNWLGYSIHVNPGPFLIVQPTVEIGKRFSKQRAAPMIAACEVLRDRVREPRERDSGNTLLVKEFPGGILMITGANSSAGLRSMPARDLMLDEIDAYPGDVEGEGDPVGLAEARTDAFPNRKILLESTPTIEGLSRIEAEYQASDQRRYFIPCPECGHMDFLTWTGYRNFLDAEDGGHHRIEWEKDQPETAHMVCGNADCGAAIPEWRKTEMLARGEWRPTAAAKKPGTYGYHISGLYSPYGWKSWADCVWGFIAAKNDPVALKRWINTTLGETWREIGDQVKKEQLADRLEVYAADVPNGVGVLVASVDVQGDRLEAIIKGYGAGEESWLIAFTQLLGDPARAKVWFDLDEFLQQEFECESGRKVKVERAVVDSGGAHTEHVYNYCRIRTPLTYPIKGGVMVGQPLVGRPSAHNRYKVPLYVLCVDSGKDTVLSRLAITTPGPGYTHLRDGAVDDEYLAQLTAEKAVRTYVKGRGLVREWKKLRERNEAFDLEVYALAAFHTCGPAFVRGIAERAKLWATPVGQARPVEPAEAPELETARAPRQSLGRRRPGRGGWMSGYR